MRSERMGGGEGGGSPSLLASGGRCPDAPDASRVNRNGKPFRFMRSIRGLADNVAINIGIWALAETFRSN